jgi:hypothetical protein
MGKEWSRAHGREAAKRGRHERGGSERDEIRRGEPCEGRGGRAGAHERGRGVVMKRKKEVKKEKPGKKKLTIFSLQKMGTSFPPSPLLLLSERTCVGEKC